MKKVGVALATYGMTGATLTRRATDFAGATSAGLEANAGACVAQTVQAWRAVGASLCKCATSTTDPAATAHTSSTTSQGCLRLAP